MRVHRAHDVAQHPAAPTSRLCQLRAWLNDRPLDDASFAAYVGHLHQTGRAPATAVKAVARAARADVDRLFEQMLKVAPKPGRDPLGDAGFDPAFRVDQRGSVPRES